MTFWTSEELKRRAIQDRIISEFDANRVKHGAYEMSLGPEIFITSDSSVKRTLVDGEQVRIPPGQLALLLTEETVAIPDDTMAFISIKAGRKLGGLINVSGFHVDPGFHGRLKFSVYNAGNEPVIVARGKAIFPIWFAQLSERTEDVYDGQHQGQMEITTADVEHMQGHMASPASLRKDLDSLKMLVKIGHVIAATVVIAVISAVASGWIGSFGKPQQNGASVASEASGLPKESTPPSNPKVGVAQPSHEEPKQPDQAHMESGAE
jgi:dCTP deaminase